MLAYNDQGAEDGSQYLVMPLMQGGDLVNALPRLNAMQRVRAIRGALCGLEALHKAGILHFDVSSHMDDCCYYMPDPCHVSFLHSSANRVIGLCQG